MNPQTEQQVRDLCDFVATQPNCSRNDIIKGMRLSGEYSDSTVYRWITAAIDRGWLKRSGNTSSATYEATDQIRQEALRKRLAIDVKKRPKVGYNSDWIMEYEPNKTSYLREKDLASLHAKCLPGSAPLTKLNEHEVSMFMCDIAFSSSRLEGNQYDFAGTIQLVERHIESSGGSARDKVMILNHRDAVRYMIESHRNSEPWFGINTYTLRSLHTMLSHDLLKLEMCGAMRKTPVEVYGSAYIPLDMPDQIQMYFEVMATKAAMIKDPFESAFFLLTHMPYLQPFEDCNKRTSRTACNIPLLMGGVTPMSWLDVTERPRDYTDAVIAVYEHNDTLLLADVFKDCFMRSAERFTLLQKQTNPDPISARYRQEIKTAIRERVINGADLISPTVAQEDAADFIAYIDRELEALKRNEMLGVRYGIAPSLLERWRDYEHRSAGDDDSQDAESEREWERMRA